MERYGNGEKWRSAAGKCRSVLLTACRMGAVLVFQLVFHLLKDEYKRQPAQKRNTPEKYR